MNSDFRYFGIIDGFIGEKINNEMRYHQTIGLINQQGLFEIIKVPCNPCSKFVNGTIVIYDFNSNIFNYIDEYSHFQIIEYMDLFRIKKNYELMDNDNSKFYIVIIDKFLRNKLNKNEYNKLNDFVNLEFLTKNLNMPVSDCMFIIWGLLNDNNKNNIGNLYFNLNKRLENLGLNNDNLEFIKNIYLYLISCYFNHKDYSKYYLDLIKKDYENYFDELLEINNRLKKYSFLNLNLDLLINKKVR